MISFIFYPPSFLGRDGRERQYFMTKKGWQRQDSNLRPSGHEPDEKNRVSSLPKIKNSLDKCFLLRFLLLLSLKASEKINRPTRLISLSLIYWLVKRRPKKPTINDQWSTHSAGFEPATSSFEGCCSFPTELRMLFCCGTILLR